jgi:hypothetical protein
MSKLKLSLEIFIRDYLVRQEALYIQLVKIQRKNEIELKIYSSA